MATKADRFRARVKAQKGKRYIFGYEVRLSDPNPKAFDCSELVQWAFFQSGYKVVDGSFNQYPHCNRIKPKNGKYITPADLRVGDLFFLKKRNGFVYHVGIYVGKGEVIEARGRRYGVVQTNLPAIRRRGGIWCRYRGINLGSLTPASAPKKKPVTTPTQPGTPPIKVGKPLLRRGDSGYWVKVLKQRMNKHLPARLRIDPKEPHFGPITESRVLWLQKKKFFPNSPKEWDGVVGPKTWGKLG